MQGSNPVSFAASGSVYQSQFCASDVLTAVDEIEKAFPFYNAV
jgi:hypothetical protein